MRIIGVEQEGGGELKENYQNTKKKRFVNKKCYPPY